MRTQGGRRVIGTAKKARALVRELAARRRAIQAPANPGDCQEFYCECDWFADLTAELLDLTAYRDRRGKS